MFSKLKKLAKKNWHIILFAVLLLISTAYLIFYRGVWAFVDSGYFYSDFHKAFRVTSSKFNQFTIESFYLGFDNSSNNFSHIFINSYVTFLIFVFGSDLGQIVYYVLYYILTFIFSFKLIKYLFKENSSMEVRVGALFLTFNPISLLITSQISLCYVYTFTIVLMYSLAKFLKQWSWGYLFLGLTSVVYIFTYLRLIPIVFLIVSFTFLIFAKHLKFWKYKIKWINLAIFSILSFLLISPFVVNNFVNFTSRENIVSNYQQGYDKYSSANYLFKSNFANSLSFPGGFTPSALSFMYNNRGLTGFSDNYAVKDSIEWFKISHILFNLTLFALSLIFLRKNWKGLKTLMFIIFIIILNTIGFFVNLDLFKKLHQTILVFIYNDYGFLQFVQIFLTAWLLIFIMKELKEVKYKRVFAIFSLVFIIFNTLPLISNHYALQKVNDVPKEYQETIFTDKPFENPEATLFVPYHWTKFEWAPYFLDVNFAGNSKYSNLIFPNPRNVPQEYLNFYNSIFEKLSNPNLANISIFNYKSIFIFKDVDSKDQNIDTFGLYRLKDQSERYQKDLNSQVNFQKTINNQRFTQYSLPQSENYNFTIYSPKTITKTTRNDFFLTPLKLQDRPLMLDAEINKMTLLPFENLGGQDAHIDYKVSPLNSTKYLVKVSDFDPEKPFIVHLNQTFSRNWKLYLVDQPFWESYKCDKDYVNFEITNNSYCHLNSPVVDYNDLSLLQKSYLPGENQIKGNFIGNSYLIEPQNLSDTNKQQKTFYAVIYYDKQFSYIITLTISFATMMFLICMLVLSLIIRKSNKINIAS